MTTRFATVDSPLGALLLSVDEDGLTRVEFPDPDGAHHPDPGWVEVEPADEPVLAAASEQLAGYFAGERTDFELPLAPVGTPFQKQVWEALSTIGHGQTCSYGQLAAQLGRPTASRAVAQAIGRNPLGIVLPCHRVIGSDGSLTGYASGLERKRFLLQLEGVPVP